MKKAEGALEILRAYWSHHHYLSFLGCHAPPPTCPVPRLWVKANIINKSLFIGFFNWLIRTRAIP